MLLCAVGHWRDSEPSREPVSDDCGTSAAAGRKMFNNSFMSSGILFWAWSSIWTPLRSNHRGRAPPTDRWLCVCVCFCPHLGKNLVWWGKGGGVWRGRGGGEMWGEVSRGAAGETPTPASCCLRWAHPQPGCLPACPNPKLSDLPYSDLTPRKKKTHTHTLTKVQAQRCQERCCACVLLVSPCLGLVSSRVPGQRSLAMALNQMALKEPHRWLQGTLWSNNKYGSYFCILTIRDIMESLRREIWSWFDLQYLQKPGWCCVGKDCDIFRICPLIMSHESIYTGHSNIRK